VIMGGAKASTKVPVIKSFLRNAQAVLVGGIIANDILKARGQDVQQSIVDDDAEKLLAGVDLTDKRLWVPSDFVIDDGKFLDIGAESIGRFIGEIRTAKMIIWNGPMGMFEKDKFMSGQKRQPRQLLILARLVLLVAVTRSRRLISWVFWVNFPLYQPAAERC